MNTKSAIRREIRDQRGSMPPELVKAFSIAAQRHILADNAWKNARRVGLYAAVRRETETALLARDAWASGKQVFFPYTSPEQTGVMHLLPCGPSESLVSNRFGIPEPVPKKDLLSGESEEAGLDLIIVPGVAFDLQGRRIGSGFGYYDRLLARPGMRGAVRIALAYSFQVLKEIPAEKWDVPMHAIATEEGFIWL